MMKLKREKVQPNFLKDWKPVKDGMLLECSDWEADSEIDRMSEYI